MVKIKETIDIYSIETPLDLGENIEINHITPFVNMLFPGDKLKIIIIIDNTDPYTFAINTTDDIDEILELNDYIDDDSETVIKIEIIKRNLNTLNIYNFDCFIDYLNQLTLTQILENFKRFSQNTEKVLLKFFDNEGSIFSTNLFSTKKYAKDINNTLKKERFEHLNISTNSASISSFNFIPEDFKVTDCSKNLLPLKKVFDKISIFLSISFVSDWAKLNHNELQFKILGYKKVDTTFSFSHNIENLEAFYKIYRWVYEAGNGNIDDKLGLARNIISRYIKHEKEELSLDSDAYSSIISSYKIYLKENVEKYIETKNKVAELTQEFTVKNREIINYITNTFRNNNLTLLSYFISLFIFNSLSNKSSTIFSIQTFIVSVAVLLISLIYLRLMYKQSKKDLMLNIRYFFSIKKIYSDIFDKQELENIFSKQHIKYNNNNVQKTLEKYIQYWIYEIIILFLMSFFITFLNDYIS